ncbi:hypothetical protein [uncultured Roseobacter sp.]|uniref:hypothetical protein n=1 Tax=uncultured Roseobacter sp. TaxID=114847 RepID=UPI002608C752|nr:hypothetical protein [uncultured Roseobacter sp.]
MSSILQHMKISTDLLISLTANRTDDAAQVKQIRKTKKHAFLATETGIKRVL